jgi:hypothetical protein
MIKVMFLATIACPRYDPEGECTFDGKIGTFPFIEKVAAKRTSKNREKGTSKIGMFPFMERVAAKQTLQVLRERND